MMMAAASDAEASSHFNCEFTTTADNASSCYMGLFYVRRTLLRMLYDRGYSISQSDLAMPILRFRALFGDNPARHALTISAQHHSSCSDRIIVVFPDQMDVKVPTIMTLVEQMKEESAQRSIMVLRRPLKNDAKKCIPVIEKTKYRMEVFLESELLVNIMDHALIPKHKLLSTEEKQALLECYAVDEKQLPYMQEDDPVARYYGLKRGDVVKIFRTDDTGEEKLFYRLVVRTKPED